MCYYSDFDMDLFTVGIYCILVVLNYPNTGEEWGIHIWKRLKTSAQLVEPQSLFVLFLILLPQRRFTIVIGGSYKHTWEKTDYLLNKAIEPNKVVI
jgi:hypothetical protein